MRRIAALGIVLALAWWIVNLDAPDGAPLRVTGLALGITLIAAYLAGVLLERFRLPRVTGYLLFGLVCGPYLLNIINRPMARELQLFNGLAVALIAFIAGLEINVRRMRPRLAAIGTLSLAILATLYSVLFVLFWIVWPWLPIAPDASGLLRAALAFLLTAVVASFSPTVTIAVVAESRAAGLFTETVLAVVILADLVLILMFTGAMEVLRWVAGAADGAAHVGLLASASWEILGSLAFGAIVGSLFSLYLRGIGREVTLVLVGVCALLSVAARALHFEPVLSALAAGLVVENVAPPEGDTLKHAVERGALPVLVIFFVAAGASLQIDALKTIGLVALAIAVARGVLAWAGAALGSRLAGATGPVGTMLWMGLIPQAGVTLGLTLIAAQEFPEWGGPFQTLMVSLIAINQLAGPVLFRTALARAGEIGRMDADAAPRPQAS